MTDHSPIPYYTDRPGTVCIGYHWWSRHAIRPFLGSPEHRVAYGRNPAHALRLARQSDFRLALRASGPYDELISAARRDHIDVATIEDGFLRSAGLGRELARPLSLVLDRTGVHYDPSQPSDLETLIQSLYPDAGLMARADVLIERLRKLRLSKYNVGRSQAPDSIRRLAGGRPLVLVAGQVEGDASLRKGSHAMRRNRDLLEAARAMRPDACLLYKPHPEVERGHRAGPVPTSVLAAMQAHVVRDVQPAFLFPDIEEVHVMTSLIGFEALIHGCRVVTHGAPFYAGWGLTQDRQPIPRRTRTIDLAHLVAASLILYPAYYDPLRNRACSVERIVDILADKGAPPLDSWLARGWRGLHRMRTDLSGARGGA